MIFQLPEDPTLFPDPRLGEPNGLFAVGGDLSPERMRTAYSLGIFPWSPWRSEYLQWFCPMQRFVIFPQEIHISHSMRSLLRKNLYSFSINADFEGVVRNCSLGSINENRSEHPGAWLGEDMIKTMLQLHESGDALSVEVWDMEGNLVGGLYGILSDRIFCGESMFSKVPSGSKLALIAFARYLQLEDCPLGKVALIDCQFETPHLRSMGARFITYEHYLAMNGIVLSPLKED